MLKSSSVPLSSGPKPWEVGGKGRGVSKMKGYSMDKQRPTGGAESSSTWDRLVHQMKTRKLDFSRKGFNDMWDFSKGRRNSPWWNFISGKGFSGKAQPGRMRGASR